MKKKWENKENQDVSGNLYSIFILTEAKGSKIIFWACIANTISRKKNKAEGFRLPDFKSF